MSNLPELSELTKRKLELQWHDLLDKENLTGEHLARFDRGRNRILAEHTTASSSHEKDAAKKLGLGQSRLAAQRRFRDLDSEYWLRWTSEGSPYETYRNWLDSIEQQILSEFASIWKGRSDATDRWYEKTCKPLIEAALTPLIKGRIAQARQVELQRLDRTRADEYLNPLKRAASTPVLPMATESLNSLQPSEQPRPLIAEINTVVSGEETAKRLETPRNLGPKLSERDAGVQNIVGEKRFRTLTNSEIMKDPDVKKRLRVDAKLQPGDAAKRCLDRIRHAKGFPLSREIKEKRAPEK
jgi:hypothetical protein